MSNPYHILAGQEGSWGLRYRPEQRLEWLFHGEVLKDAHFDSARWNAIASGYIATPLNEKLEANPELGDINQVFAASITVGLRGHPDDISRAAVFLLAPESSFIAGTVLFLDGGHDALIRPDNF